jgi:hypothetical protein
LSGSSARAKRIGSASAIILRGVQDEDSQLHLAGRFEEKNIVKHHVNPAEIVEAFFNRRAFRRIEPGQRRGEDLYAAYG